MKVTFKNWNCIAKGASYTNGNKAIVLIDAEDGEMVATASVNIIEEKIDNDVVFVKNYSENGGMTDALIQADIVEPDIIHDVKTGFVNVKAYKLTEKALDILW